MNALLTAAPSGRHICQLHKEAPKLAESVGEFVAAGFKRGERVVMIATPEHVSLVLQHLSWNDWNAEAFQTSGQLQILDARATLKQFMKDDKPDWNVFRKVVGGLLAQRASSKLSGVRAYGEMVNLLWHDGNEAGAIALEDFWNRIASEHRFALFCCYMLDGLKETSYNGLLADIGRTHSDLIQTTDDQKFQAAVDAASREVLGSTLSMTLSLSGREDVEGEHRLPAGHRSILWLKRNMPHIASRVLDRARHYYELGTSQQSNEGLV